MSADDYDGCEMFISPDGLAGFALGKAGNKAGVIFDLFIRTNADEKVEEAIVALAVERGAQQLVTYDDTLLARFSNSLDFMS